MRSSNFYRRLTSQLSNFQYKFNHFESIRMLIGAWNCVTFYARNWVKIFTASIEAFISRVRQIKQHVMREYHRARPNINSINSSPSSWGEIKKYLIIIESCQNSTQHRKKITFLMKQKREITFDDFRNFFPSPRCLFPETSCDGFHYFKL